MTTLSDVAKRANVSKMTVSRVINHPEQVTDELKELVFSAMKELNYRPNIAAKALVTNRSQIIKLFILEEIDTTEPYYMNLLMGIASAVGEAHYSLQLITADAFDVGVCDGYIITGFRSKDFEWIERLEKPVILFGENNRGIDFVDSNNILGTTLTTEYALKCNYKNVVYIGINIDEPFELSREEGYKNVMNKNNMLTKIYRFSNHTTEVKNFIIENWSLFSEGEYCFICSSDRLAMGVERGIIESGGRIPNDFGVIGFDGVFLDQVSSPKLTTAKQNITKMGETCGEMLVKIIESGGKSQGFHYYVPELIVRESTR